MGEEIDEVRKVVIVIKLSLLPTRPKIGLDPFLDSRSKVITLKELFDTMQANH